MEGYLAQLRYRGKTLILPQTHVPDFVDSPWDDLPLLRVDEEWGRGKQQEEREWELKLVCKMRKYCFF